MSKTLKQAIGVALVALASSASAGVLVDLFSTPQALLSDSTTGDGGLSSSVGIGIDPTILGGERDLYVELLTRSIAAPNSRAELSVGGGAMSFSVGSLATGTATVQWDGADNSSALNPIGLGGVNLGATGSAFRVDTLFSDLGFEFVIEAYSSATQWTRISFEAHSVAAPTSSYIAFDGFTNLALCGAVNPNPGVNSITCGAGGPADFANLGALQLIVDPNGGTTAVDLTIDSVTTVPEPGVLALLGSAIFGFGALRRRKQA